MIRFHGRRAQCDSDEYAQEEIVLKYTELASVTNEQRVPELNLKESSKRRVDLSLAEERQVSEKHLSYPKSSVDGTLKYENAV